MASVVGEVVASYIHALRCLRCCSAAVVTGLTGQHRPIQVNKQAHEAGSSGHGKGWVDGGVGWCLVKDGGWGGGWVAG